MQAILDKFANWTFLNEPAYRWAIFFVGFTFFLAAWNGVLNFMK